VYTRIHVTKNIVDRLVVTFQNFIKINLTLLLILTETTNKQTEDAKT